jgi:hypothetical protein
VAHSGLRGGDYSGGVARRGNVLYAIHAELTVQVYLTYKMGTEHNRSGTTFETIRSLDVEG